MEYPLEIRDLEAMEEIKQEHNAMVNNALNNYLTAIVRQKKLPLQPYGYGLDPTMTKLIPNPKP